MSQSLAFNNIFFICKNINKSSWFYDKNSYKVIILKKYKDIDLEIFIWFWGFYFSLEILPDFQNFV